MGIVPGIMNFGQRLSICFCFAFVGLNYASEDFKIDLNYNRKDFKVEGNTIISTGTLEGSFLQEVGCDDGLTDVNVSFVNNGTIEGKIIQESINCDKMKEFRGKYLQNNPFTVVVTSEAVNKGKVTGDVIQLVGCGAQGYLDTYGTVLGGAAQNNIDCEATMDINGLVEGGMSQINH